MDIKNASELDLLTAWLKKVRERGDKLFTRSNRAEVRHVCLYASQQLQELRTYVLKDDMSTRHTIAELKEVITDLEGLVSFLESGKGGGFSALKDKNK